MGVIDISELVDQKTAFNKEVQFDGITNDGKHVRFSTRFIYKFYRDTWESMVQAFGEDGAKEYVADDMYESVAHSVGLFQLREEILRVVNERILDNNGNWTYTTPCDEVRAKVNEVLDEFFSELYPRTSPWS